MSLPGFTSRRTVLKTLGVAAAGIAGAVGASASPFRQAQPKFTTIASFDPPQLPENVAITGDGTHYLSMASTGEIWELAPDGDASPESVASLPLPEVDILLRLKAEESRPRLGY